MILLVLAAIGATILIYSCICLIVGIATRRNPLSYILDKKPRKIEWVFETLRILPALIGMSVLLYWQLINPEVSRWGSYQLCFCVYFSAFPNEYDAPLSPHIRVLQKQVTNHDTME